MGKGEHQKLARTIRNLPGFRVVYDVPLRAIVAVRRTT
jgi:hypothetical protein